MPLYSQRLDEALVFAADAFRYRRRKGTDTPYLSHLLQVMVTVAEGGGSEDQMIAALLHDYLEDIEGAERTVLAARFGEEVAGLVEAMSDATTWPKPPWSERKAVFIERMRGAKSELKLICAADKLHNARCILRDLALEGSSVWDRFSASQAQTVGYYRGVYDALALDWDHWTLRELELAVVELEAQP